MANKEEEKPVMVVGIEDNEHSLYGLEWTLDHFFINYSSNYPFKLVLLHAKPTPASIIGLTGEPVYAKPNPVSIMGLAGDPGSMEVFSAIDADLKQIAARVAEKATEICKAKSVNDVVVEVVEGDARNVLCETVDKLHASVLVVGSHGYGAIKRAFLGSVSDHCAHHAHCSVMIVKKPKNKS